MIEEKNNSLQKWKKLCPAPADLASDVFMFDILCIDGGSIRADSRSKLAGLFLLSPATLSLGIRLSLLRSFSISLCVGSVRFTMVRCDWRARWREDTAQVGRSPAKGQYKR
ncbi:MAG: hypothetical protein JXM70_09550 [Pirellulales bacterium]|nr:hypothetical protein [Pirellulales bacterium]